MMKVVLLALVLVGTFQCNIAAAEPTRIFLFTNEIPSGSVDEQLKARQDALRELSNAFSGPQYKETITLVPSKDRADVIVELVSRGETTRSASGSSTRASGGGTASRSQSSSVTKRHLAFRISKGASTHDLVTEDQLPWPKMAEKAASDIAAWAAVH
jgi:hypothetical protein